VGTKGFALGLVALVLMLTACVKEPGSEPGPMHTWFNQYGQAQSGPIPGACAQKQPFPDDTPVKVPGGVIPKGYDYAVYTLKVDSISVSADKPQSQWNLEYCIPVSLYVYATASEVPAQFIELGNGEVTRSMPFNALRNTPWRATIVVAWDSKSLTAPVMNFELIAKVETGPGLAHLPVPTDSQIGLMCRITQDVAPLSLSMSTDVFAPTEKLNIAGVRGEYFHGPVVKCRPPAFSARAQL
jgi:hypothetical protein